jgi:hypothetical protein
MFSDGRHKPSVLIYSGLVLCLMWVGVAGAGCRTDGTEAKRGRTRAFSSAGKSVDSILLFTSPVLFNLDGKPGPDGFSARVFAIHNGIAKPVKITNGTLEIIIYDGNATPDQSLNPRQVWSYSKTDLPRYLSQTSIGFSYDFTLKIDKSKPLPGKVSIGAKYTPPEGDAVFAKTVSIAIEP